MAWLARWSGGRAERRLSLVGKVTGASLSVALVVGLLGLMAPEARLRDGSVHRRILELDGCLYASR
jgi:hypothetical protein